MAMEDFPAMVTGGNPQGWPFSGSDRYGEASASVGDSKMVEVCWTMEFYDFPYPMDPSTFLGSVWGIIYYNLEA